MVGLTNQVNGLYKLTMNIKTTTVTTQLQHASLVHCPYKHVSTTHNFSFFSIIPYNSIWNFKLGHLSNSRLCGMAKFYP